MPKLRLTLLLAMAIAACAAPSAAAEAIVPPGNSAATQYTETLPTTGGEKGDGGHKGGAVPAKTLGGRNAHRLESKGPQGKAVAKFAAETAPASVAATATRAAGEAAGAGGASETGGGAQGGGGNGNVGGGNGATTNGGAGNAAKGAAAASDQPAGSSGIGEVLGQATGSSSSGTLGLLLPLIVVAAIAFSLFHLWRQRQRVV